MLCSLFLHPCYKDIVCEVRIFPKVLDCTSTLKYQLYLLNYLFHYFDKTKVLKCKDIIFEKTLDFAKYFEYSDTIKN